MMLLPYEWHRTAGGSTKRTFPGLTHNRNVDRLIDISDDNLQLCFGEHGGICSSEDYRQVGCAVWRL